jgi:hypothetical protein
LQVAEVHDVMPEYRERRARRHRIDDSGSRRLR